MNSFKDIMIQNIDKAYDHQFENDEWTKGDFFKMNQLKPDNSGKVGELTVSQICKKLNIPYHYEEDKNSQDGTYDIIVNKKMIELKTGRKSFGSFNFQHESLHKKATYDYLAFLDIYPTGQMIFCLIKSEEMRWDSKIPVINRKPHLRLGTEDIYKLDFGKKTHQNLIKNNMAIDLSLSSEEEFLNFLISREVL